MTELSHNMNGDDVQKKKKVVVVGLGMVGIAFM